MHISFYGGVFLFVCDEEEEEEEEEEEAKHIFVLADIELTKKQQQEGHVPESPNFAPRVYFITIYN